VEGEATTDLEPMALVSINEDGKAEPVSNPMDETSEQAAINKRRWTPPKKFDTVAEFIAATLDVRTRAEALLVDIQAIHRSAENIINSTVEDGKKVIELELENVELKGKLAKLKEAMSDI